MTIRDIDAFLVAGPHALHCLMKETLQTSVPQRHLTSWEVRGEHRTHPAAECRDSTVINPKKEKAKAISSSCHERALCSNYKSQGSCFMNKVFAPGKAFCCD